MHRAERSETMHLVELSRSAYTRNLDLESDLPFDFVPRVLSTLRSGRR